MKNNVSQDLLKSDLSLKKEKSTYKELTEPNSPEPKLRRSSYLEAEKSIKKKIYIPLHRKIKRDEQFNSFESIKNRERYNPAYDEINDSQVTSTKSIFSQP